MRRLMILAVALVSFTSSAAAQATCGPWIPNTNGTKWRLCTDAKGLHFCELKTGSKITRFACD